MRIKTTAKAHCGKYRTDFNILTLLKWLAPKNLNENSDKKPNISVSAESTGLNSETNLLVFAGLFQKMFDNGVDLRPLGQWWACRVVELR